MTRAAFCVIIRAFLTGAMLIGTARADELVLIDADAPIVGEISAATSQGIRFSTDDERPTLHPWFEVRSVIEGDAPALIAHVSAGREVRRAQSRLARDDMHGALRVLRAIPDEYTVAAGPMTERISSIECAARARLGDSSGALVPWLTWIRSRPGTDPGAPSEALAPLVDDRTRLLIIAPPIWSSTDPARARFLDARSIERAIGRDETAGAFAGLYVLAAQACRPSAGSTADQYDAFRRDNARLIASDPGLALVAEVVGALAGDAQTRRASRERLRARPKPNDPPWIRQWCALAIGRSLTLEPDATDARVGIATLLDTVLTDPDGPDALTRVALLCAIDGAETIADHDAARVLRRELLSRYPDALATDTSPQGPTS